MEEEKDVYMDGLEYRKCVCDVCKKKESERERWEREEKILRRRHWIYAVWHKPWIWDKDLRRRRKVKSRMIRVDVFLIEQVRYDLKSDEERRLPSRVQLVVMLMMPLMMAVALDRTRQCQRDCQLQDE